MMRARLSLAAAIGLAVAGVASAGAATVKAPPPQVVYERKRQARAIGAGAVSHLNRSRRGPSWTVAQVKRQARKARNQARHRAHCKRRGR